MNKEYPFWKLLSAQWSWKNELSYLWVWYLVSLFTQIIFFLTGSITYTEVESLLQGVVIFVLVTIIYTIYMIILWQMLKFVIMFICCLVVWCALNKSSLEKDDPTYKDYEQFYKEMLTWRK